MNLVQRLRNGRADQDELNDAADRIEQLESENAELRKDAERYRAYRAYFRDNDADLEIAHALALTDSDVEFDAIWDKEIDAALAKEKRR